MHLGMIGLGRMGGNMVERLRADGHTVVGFDVNPEVTEVPSLEALRDALPAPRAIWVMVLAGPSNTSSPARTPTTRSQYFSARSTWWMFSRMEMPIS